MKTIEEVIDNIVDEHKECRWMDAGELREYLEVVAQEQKAIDDDAVHAIVEEQVLKAIEKQKAIDIDKALDAHCEYCDHTCPKGAECYIRENIRKAMEK